MFFEPQNYVFSLIGQNAIYPQKRIKNVLICLFTATQMENLNRRRRINNFKSNFYLILFNLPFNKDINSLFNCELFLSPFLTSTCPTTENRNTKERFYAHPFS